jgi:hypothetical protein
MLLGSFGAMPNKWHLTPQWNLSIDLPELDYVPQSHLLRVVHDDLVMAN